MRINTDKNGTALHVARYREHAAGHRHNEWN